MKSLSTLFGVHALLSFLAVGLWSALFASVLLAVFMAFSYCFADWKSMRRGVQWLREHAKIRWGVMFGMASTLVLMAAYWQRFPALLLVSQVIFGFFFLGAAAAGLVFWNTGIRQIAGWLGFR